MTGRIISRIREVGNDTVFVILVDNTKWRRTVMKKSFEIFGVEANGVPACCYLSGNVGTNRIRVVDCRRVIGWHVRRIKRFIIAKAETVTNADRDISEFIKDPGFLEVYLPLLPAQGGDYRE
jgi:hypothetical protein